MLSQSLYMTIGSFFIPISCTSDAVSGNKHLSKGLDLIHKVLSRPLDVAISHLNKCLDLNEIDLENQINSLVGKSFNKTEIQDLLKKNNEEFKKRIEEKFIEKRNQRIKIIGEKQAMHIEKTIFLQSIDLNWKSHIQYLEQLRQVIGLRSYGQRDPLVEYKREAFTLFESLLDKLKLDLITILLNLSIVEKPIENNKEKQKNVKIDPKYVGKKMSRNEPCFCGSGKKYKYCCGSL